MTRDSGLTSTDIIASASEFLIQGGYHRIRESFAGVTLQQNARLFEDPYGVIELVVYDTWNELSSRWSDAQGMLVDTISKFMHSSDPKAWDGYLVLLTPSLLPGAAAEKASQIRNNTNRVRKFLATGDELKTTADVERVLLPLMPLSSELGIAKSAEKALELLPELLARRGIDASAAKTLVEAFLQQQPLIERLHAYRTGR